MTDTLDISNVHNNKLPLFLIGNKPFAMSPIKVIKALVLLPSRSILVAPGLLEPEFRGSGRRKTIDTRIALDREPIKYAKRGKDQ